MRFVWIFLFVIVGCNQPGLMPENSGKYSYFYKHFRDIDQIKSAMSKNKDFDINAKYGEVCYQTTLLHWAAKINDLKMVKFLVRSGGRLLIYDDFISTPIAETTSPEVMEFFIKNGVDINQGSYMHNFSPLHIAITRGDIEMVKFCIKHGANLNINSASARADTPLSLAFNRLEICKSDRPSFFAGDVVASCKNLLSIIKLLVESGADVNKTAEWGEFSPLKAAIKTNNNEIIDLMLRYGAR